MDSLLNDVRVAFRQCRRQPGFALAVIATLALAIAANVSMFSVVNAVLLRGLPYERPEQLVWITSVRADNQDAPFSLPEFIDYRSQARTLSGIAAYANWSASIARRDMTERLQGARMSANSFSVLGLTAAAGRLLQETDDRADAPRVALLSYRLWQREFGGAISAVGTSLRINGESFEVVGVLPPQFPLPLREIDVVVPLAPDRDPPRHVRTSVNFLRLFGRLNEDTTAQQAQQELTAICRALRQQFPVEYVRKDGVRALALHDVLVGDYRQVMWFLLGAVVVVLSTALANLLSLVLIRANDRRAELSIRMALGGSRIRLLSQLSVEALLLTSAGGMLGLVLATWVSRAAVPWVPASIPRIGEVGVDGYVLLFAFGLALGIAMLLSVAPVGSVMAIRAGDSLQLASRGAVGDRWQQYVRNVLVVGEISTALVLLLVTVGLVQAVVRLQNVPPGFRPDPVFQARISMPPTYRSREDLILDVICGDKDFWVISATQNIAHVKPAKAGGATNLNLVSASGTVYSFLLSEKNGGGMPDLKVYVKDEGVPRGRPKYYSAAQVEGLQAELAEMRSSVEAAQRQASEAIATYQQQYPARLQFTYITPKYEKPFLVRAIWHDGQFTYIKADAIELPALYETKEGEPALVNFQVQGGTYIVPKVLDRGYLSLGKQRLTFAQQER